MFTTSKKTEKVLLSTEELAGLPRAGLFRRLAALLYDMFLVIAIWICLGFVLQLIYGPETSRVVDGEIETDPVLGRLMFFMMVTSAATFYVWFWQRSGQTLGMIAWRTRVLDRDNHLLDTRRGLIRFFAAWPCFWLFGLGYLWLYIDRDGDAVHEKLSGSKTVLLPKHARPF